MDVTDRDDPKWRDWENRTALIGLNASATVANPYTGQPGSDECVNGWRGLTPLALNPLWAPPFDPRWQHMDPPGVADTVHWTHWDDLKTIYGVGDTRFARDTWDNVGVQYGLQALRESVITPAEFLDLNAQVGSWNDQPNMVDEGCPFNSQLCADPTQFDPWSARNMRLSPDGGATPAPRPRLGRHPRPPAGPCTERFPIYGTSRTVAGAPLTDDVYACRLQPVRAAIARGGYGDWQPRPAERDRLELIFPTGVCRYWASTPILEVPLLPGTARSRTDVSTFPGDLPRLGARADRPHR